MNRGTGSTPTEREAQRRLQKAYDLIASAYRLHSFDPRETISRVQSAISEGAEAQAQDLTEEAYRAA